MGSLTDFGENALIDHVFGTTYTPSATLYLALYTDDPDDDGTATEADYTGYARTEITLGLAASRTVTQDALVTYNQCTVGTNVISHWGIMELVSGGDMLAHGALTATKTVSPGKTPSVASTEVFVEFNAGIISTYLADELLDLMFNNVAYTQPAIWVALVETSTVSDSDDGSTIDELDMTGYQRRQAGTGWTVVGSTITNDGVVDFGQLTSTGETVVSAVLCDNSTTGAGEVLFYDNAQNQPIDDGDNVQYASGAFDLEMR